MNDHALLVLEFREALSLVAGRAIGELGRDAVLRLAPGSDPESIRREHRQVWDLAEVLEEAGSWYPPNYPDAFPALARLDVQGTVLEPTELRVFSTLLEASESLAEFLSASADGYPSLVGLGGSLCVQPELNARLLRTIAPDGSILDSASPALRSIRRSLNSLRGRIVGRLEKYLSTVDERFLVPDASVTIREGRYVVPIRREGRGAVGGAIHGESATGQTLFVEPPIGQEMMGEIRGLERDQSREIFRILRELSEELAPLAPSLRATQQALVEFDSRYARARAALAWGSQPIDIPSHAEGALKIVSGRHPILFEKLGSDTIPFDLELEGDERILVVSGPNTGGKSVFLKSVGLFAALSQAGVVPPAKTGTRLPIFRQIFADIGDEQSIQDDLSTFSAHIVNLKTVLETAGPDCLVLIDEMGTGTDPEEGAALSRAILGELLERGSRVIATSHLGELKRLASEVPGVVNGSLQFNQAEMVPTFRFEKGMPGRSYGLATAHRFGLPAALLERAASYLSEEKLRVEGLLESLEVREEKAQALEAELQAERDRVVELRTSLEARSQALREQESTAKHRAEEEARRLLLDARAEVEGAIAEVRAAENSREIDDVTKAARRKVEQAAARHTKQGRVTSPAPSADGAEFVIGGRVRLREGNTSGQVIAIAAGIASVEIGGLRAQIPLRELVPLGPADANTQPPRPSSHSAAEMLDRSAKFELDLRGQRADEARMEVIRFMDEGVLGGLSEVRIIHGKGTGALRAVVEEVLRSDPRVASFRLGRPGEGGGGVTMAELR